MSDESVNLLTECRTNQPGRPEPLPERLALQAAADKLHVPYGRLYDWCFRTGKAHAVQEGKRWYLTRDEIGRLATEIAVGALTGAAAGTAPKRQPLTEEQKDHIRQGQLAARAKKAAEAKPRAKKGGRPRKEEKKASVPALAPTAPTPAVAAQIVGVKSVDPDGTLDSALAILVSVRTFVKELNGLIAAHFPEQLRAVERV